MISAAALASTLAIDRSGRFVGFVNWRGFGLLRRRFIRLCVDGGLLQHLLLLLETVQTRQHEADLPLHPRLGVNVRGRGSQQVKRAIKMLSRFFGISCLEIVLPGLEFFLHVRDQRVGGVGPWSQRSAASDCRDLSSETWTLT